MDAKTTLRRRVGDTPIQRTPKLAAALGLSNLFVKLEGANPTGTQKDRIAHLEVGSAVAQNMTEVTLASCGNFGVAIANAAYFHNLPCTVFVPAEFAGERVELMQTLGAKVRPVPGSYEDAVVASDQHASGTGIFNASPGGANTIGTLAGYSTISEEIIRQLSGAPDVVAIPIGNGSTLAGVHLGFRAAWAQGRSSRVPKVFGGSSLDNNPVTIAWSQGQRRCAPLDANSLVETEVNEPLVNWDALDGTACLSAIQDSLGAAYGATDEEMLALHAVLLEDGIDAHPASLAAAASLRHGVSSGLIEPDCQAVLVLTSGRPQIDVAPLPEPEDLGAFMAELSQWLGKFSDPIPDIREAVTAAFDDGHVLCARDPDGLLGYVVLTPMPFEKFFPPLHLSYIAVKPRGRGRGIGTILLEEAIRAADGNLSLHVETDNLGAIRLYEKFGFTKKYFRMLHGADRTPEVDPAEGAGWSDRGA